MYSNDRQTAFEEIKLSIRTWISGRCNFTAHIIKWESENISIYLHVFKWLFVCVHVSMYMQVKVNNEVATGTGPNKKVAKRNAAEAMLLQLGYKASTVPQNPTEVQRLYTSLQVKITFPKLDLQITTKRS